MYTSKQLEDLINKINDNIIDVFEKVIPHEIMITSEAPKIMYDSLLNLLKRLSIILDITPLETKNHIDRLWAGPKKMN